MRIFELARRPTRAVRVLLAIAALTLSLNVAAHTHAHEKASAQGAHAVSCGYCVAFNGMAAGPSHATMSFALAAVQLAPVFPESARAHLPLETSAQPRAPPVRP